MFFFLFSLSFCLKTASVRNLDAKLKESPITIVFFNMRSLSQTKSILDIFEKLENKYEPNVRFVRVDDKKAAPKFGISFAQQIGVFHSTFFSGFYTGKWTFEALDEFCNNALNSDFTYINNYFDLFKFQATTDINILVCDEKLKNKAATLLSSFGGLLNVGILNNSAIATEKGLPKAQLCQPLNDRCYDLDNIDAENVAKYMNPSIHHMTNEQLIGVQPMNEGYILLALFDERDPRHWHDVSENFHHVEEFFLKNISYQTIDFLDAPKLIDEFNIISFNQPIYVYIELTNKGNKINIYQRLLPSPEDLLQWLKMLILNIRPETDDSVKVGRVNASTFIEKVLNPNKDVILLVAQPKMKRYHEALENFRIIARIFAPFSDRIELYEYDNVADYIEGLQMPPSKDPVISVWSASEEPDGSTFTALASVAVLLDNIVQLVKAEFTQAEFEQMADLLQKILGTK